jgi:acyl-coenzyme A synthetase/AMP-(fatty) acid ligase/thioesterase domain-containing protein/acyl carrier protein
MLGVLRAGMVCAPIEARDPPERVAAMHGVVGADLVVTDREHRPAAERVTDPSRIVVVDELPPDDVDPRVDVPLDRPSFVFLTSGSTGTPKGVVHGQQGFLHTLDVFRAVCGLTAPDRVAISGTYSFAATALRVFGTALAGATCVAFDPVAVPVSALPDAIDEAGITVLTFVPSVFRALCAESAGSSMPSVRLVSLTGDVVFGNDVVEGRRRFSGSTAFMNRYGSTESMGVAMLVLDPDDPVPDGPLPIRMLAWNHLTLTDDDGEPVAPGEAGRMVVVGGAPALGYWRDEAATAERFFVDDQGRRGLRLDDVARLRDDGLVEFVGRWDDRVKVQGVLVHPAEVQRALIAIDTVAAGTVLARPTGDGDVRLVAYAVPRPDSELRGWEVRRDLAARLPTRMVPAAVVLLDHLPLGDRGKIDRDALPPPPPRPEPSGRIVSSRVHDLQRFFGEVLGVPDVTEADDFFSLGGDSLAATELLVAIEEHFGVDFEISALLDAPTPELLADRMVRRRPRGSSPLVMLRQADPTVPFVCVAGGGAHALGLRDLAYAVDGRTTYGLQMRGLEEAARPDYSVRAIATRNLRALGDRVGTPFVLGGYSFGGLVAFEMGRMLEARGTPPALLVLLDTPAPVDSGPARSPVTARMTTRLEREPPRLRARSRAVVRWMGEGLRVRTRRAVLVGTTGWIPRHSEQQYELFFRFSIELARRYRPPLGYGGRALVVRATETPAGRDGRRARPDLGWSDVVKGPLEVVAITTNHNGLIRPPMVAEVGRAIARAIGRDFP